MVSERTSYVDIVNAEVTGDMEQRDIIYYYVLYFIDNLLTSARKNVFVEILMNTNVLCFIRLCIDGRVFLTINMVLLGVNFFFYNSVLHNLEIG